MSSEYRKYMRRRRKRLQGLILIILGASLLIGAATLLIRSNLRSRNAEKYSKEALAAMETIVLETVPEAADPTVPETTGETEPTLPTDPEDPITLSSEFIDGHEYVGYLEFPSLDRKLPIMKIKYVDDLQIAPCLEKGSPHDDNAVISAHNYPSHFGPIRDWTGGEEVIFTDLEDRTIHYTVQLVEKISPYDVEKVMDSEYDLVMYTCTPGGANRVMVACNRTEAEE